MSDTQRNSSKLTVCGFEVVCGRRRVCVFIVIRSIHWMSTPAACLRKEEISSRDGKVLMDSCALGLEVYHVTAPDVLTFSGFMTRTIRDATRRSLLEVVRVGLHTLACLVAGKGLAVHFNVLFPTIDFGRVQTCWALGNVQNLEHE